MFLKRLILVRWGNIPDGEFEFGPVNLFSGANSSYSRLSDISRCSNEPTKVRTNYGVSWGSWVGAAF